jgi:hypothetical protein
MGTSRRSRRYWLEPISSEQVGNSLSRPVCRNDGGLGRQSGLGDGVRDSKACRVSFFKSINRCLVGSIQTHTKTPRIRRCGRDRPIKPFRRTGSWDWRIRFRLSWGEGLGQNRGLVGPQRNNRTVSGRPGGFRVMRRSSLGQTTPRQGGPPGKRRRKTATLRPNPAVQIRDEPLTNPISVPGVP